VTLLARSFTGIVAFPLSEGAALDELAGTDAVLLLAPDAVLLSSLPELDEQPRTSADHATVAYTTVNDLRTAVPL
jgi:hypothetical protein